MKPRRRAVLLLGLAALLGTLAATDVARREGALREALAPAVPVVVARREVAAGTRLTLAALAVRRVPERYAPALRYGAPRAVAGLRAAVTIPADADVTPAVVATAVPGAPEAAAQAFARELRVLPRAPGDRRHGTAGMTVGSRLR